MLFITFDQMEKHRKMESWMKRPSKSAQTSLLGESHKAVTTALMTAQPRYQNHVICTKQINYEIWTNKILFYTNTNIGTQPRHQYHFFCRKNPLIFCAMDCSYKSFLFNCSQLWHFFKICPKKLISSSHFLQIIFFAKQIISRAKLKGDLLKLSLYVSINGFLEIWLLFFWLMNG